MLLAAILFASASAPAAGDLAGAPTLAELRNATYSGLPDLPGPVTLRDGRWEGEPYEKGGASRPSVTLAGGLRAVGEIDGRVLAAVILAQSSGGSGSFSHLALVERKNGGLENVATAPLGDRVQIRSATIAGNQVQVGVVRAAPDDPACCPGEVADLSWKLEGGKLVPLAATEKPKRLSLDTIAGTEWVLRAWNLNEPAPAEPSVTLSYADGRFAGRSGCNRYTGPVKSGDMPGDIEVGPLAGTRMACPEPGMSIEARFLRQLGAAKKFGFFLGQLALSYEVEGSFGAMLLDARPAGGAATPEPSP